MENTQIFRILSLCAAVLAVCQGELAITADLSSEVVNLGENVRASCHIINEDKETFYVVWVKKVGKHETEIGTNAKMNQIYKDTNRYSGGVDFNKGGQDVSDVTFYIDIKEVEATDSGEIGCKLPKFKMSVFKELTVKVPYKSLALSSRHLDGSHEVTYSDGETIRFDEGEKRSFSCKAVGGYPKPEISLTLGDKDVSSQFNKSEEQQMEGPVGLQELTYDVELFNPNLEITFEYSKKKLQCSTNIPGTEFKRNISVNVDLNGYKPQFLCEKVILMPLHQEDVNITCHVRADPAIQGNMSEIYWERTGSHNDTILPGASLGQFTSFLEHGKDMFEKVMTLHIDHVYMNHFQTYFFQAMNDLGSVTHGVELRRDEYVHKTEATTAGTDNQVPGGKDPIPSSSPEMCVLPGLLITALLMVVMV